MCGVTIKQLKDNAAEITHPLREHKQGRLFGLMEAEGRLGGMGENRNIYGGRLLLGS